MDDQQDLTEYIASERKDSCFSLSESDTERADIPALSLVKTSVQPHVPPPNPDDNASTFTLSSVEPPPAPPSFRSSTAFIVFTASYSIFVDVFTYDIFVPVLPFSLSARSGVPESHIQFWVSTLLTTWAISYAISAPIGGFLADRLFRRRTIIFIGLVLLSISTIMLCVSKSLPVMLVARILQGISSGISWSTPLAFVADVAQKDKIGQYMGYTTVGNCIAAVLAPFLGGALYEGLGYNAIWIVNAAVIIIEIFLWLLVIEPEPPTMATRPSDSESRARTPTLPFTKTNTTTVAAIEGYDPQSPTMTPHRLVTPVIFLIKSTRLITALLCILITATLFTSFDSVLTLHVTSTFRWSSLAAGAAFIPLKIPAALSPLLGRLSDRYGARRTAALGYVVLCLALLTLSFTTTQDTVPAKVALCAVLVVIGLAINLTYCPLMGEIMHAVDVLEETHPGIFQRRGRRGGGSYAQAYGLFTMGYAVGCAVGPALAGGVLQDAGWKVMCLILCAVAGAAVLPAMLFLGGWIGSRAAWSAFERAQGLGVLLKPKLEVRGCSAERHDEKV